MEQAGDLANSWVQRPSYLSSRSVAEPRFSGGRRVGLARRLEPWAAVPLSSWITGGQTGTDKGSQAARTAPQATTTWAAKTAVFYWYKSKALNTLEAAL